MKTQRTCGACKWGQAWYDSENHSEGLCRGPIPMVVIQAMRDVIYRWGDATHCPRWTPKRRRTR